jgi:hypothetical protein
MFCGNEKYAVAIRLLAQSLLDEDAEEVSELFDGGPEATFLMTDLLEAIHELDPTRGDELIRLSKLAAGEPV